MTEVSVFERYRFLGWIITDLAVIAFVAVLGLSFVFGVGISGVFNMPVISLALMVLAVIFVGGLAFEIYGGARLWFIRRRNASETRARRRTRTRAR